MKDLKTIYIPDAGKGDLEKEGGKIQLNFQRAFLGVMKHNLYLLTPKENNKHSVQNIKAKYIF